MSSWNPNGELKWWRFTWEALGHIPTLRLYLFDGECFPSSRCRDLSARLRFDQWLLMVSWNDESEDRDVLLRVPLPRLLIDPSCSTDCAAKIDHIEVKIPLVLPVDHSIVADLCGVFDCSSKSTVPTKSFLPMELGSELKRLASGSVHLFCKFCSTKLTKQPIRNCVEMPSAYWLEASDNWFGSCCCSFGGVSENLVSRYARAYDCVEGLCMLGDASVIVCKDDIEGWESPPCTPASTDFCFSFAQVSKPGIEELGTFNVASVAQYKNSASVLPSDSCGKGEASSFLDIKVDGDNMQLNMNKCSIYNDTDIPAHETAAINQFHCCSDEIHYSSNQGTEQLRRAQLSQPNGRLSKNTQMCLRNNFLGDGFMIRASDFSNNVRWIEFLCGHCSYLLGSYPTLENSGVPADGGIRLFKCNISTDISIGGDDNIFGKYTLKKTVVNLLHENAQHELSFRVVVRDLKTKSPRLLMVLLNSKAWCCNGYCFEDVLVDPIIETKLHSVAKVAFGSSCGDDESYSRTLEDWLTKRDPEEMFMLTGQIEVLTNCLYSTRNTLLPPSCSSWQGMSLSSLEL